ncbi:MULTISPECIES: hypothetical protein [unclassified Streptomyces]|uniref:hypothetical protein n=1 Tax=unclassified Streptomyces TaxID=2593676 RepID=UPI00036FD0B7|nr:MULTISPECIES: hypothetical protein [unclassified Streptomyces]MYX37989.1 hypothetical protein [Streptomyces sp. SID8377]
MLFFHFTRPGLWPLISADAEIRATWPEGLDDVPELARAVHLTTDPSPGSLPGPFRDRTVRITVEVPAPEARRWHAWAGTRLPAGSAETLAATRFDGRPDEWFVLERAIPSAEWVSVIDLGVMQPLWPRA